MKTIFFKLFIILFILISLLLLYKPLKKSDSLYKGEKKDVYVNVTVGNQTQQILLDDYLLGVVAGEILTYQGKCISALFYSSSNGKSENVENYFQGSSQPYLISVDSHWDKQYDPKFTRKVKYTSAQLNSLFGGSFQYHSLKRYPSGRVKTIVINQKQYSGREIREKLQLASSDFEIIEEGNSYVFVTKGSGHGVGMSQYGAQGMAKEGYDYQAILKHYYQGVVISKNKE